MTEEHVPPKSSGNRGTSTLYNDIDGVLMVLREFNKGHSIPSLCRECNNTASERGLPQAYTAWHEDVIGFMRRAGSAFQDVTGKPANDIWAAVQPDGPFRVPVEHGKGVNPEQINNLHPGRIARQLLGMLLAVQRDRRLLDDYPQLAAAYFSDASTSIAPFTLHVALANAGITYATNPVRAVSVSVTDSLEEEVSSDCWLLSFPPFLIVLAKGAEPPISATRIDDWFGYRVDATFPKTARKVTYPIADQRELLVQTLYDGIARLPRP